jgi:hypothetical protein
VVVVGDVGVDEDRLQQHEVAEARVDDVAVDAHVAHAGLDGDDLVGDLPRPLAWLVAHREPDVRHHGADAVVDETAHDRVGDNVELVVVGVPRRVGRGP